MNEVHGKRFRLIGGQMSLRFQGQEAAVNSLESPVFSFSKAPWRMQEFFAGSGLVSYGLGELFSVAWANDIDEKKNEIYSRNFGAEHLCTSDVRDVSGKSIPFAHLSWASFPCQDLSLAGKRGGLNAQRSGLVWEWMRIVGEMRERPAVVVLENVAGLLSVGFEEIHSELRKLGYRSGAICVNASYFLPQSRPRVFIIGVQDQVEIPSSIVDDGPNWLHGSKALIAAAKKMDDWIWWKAPEPTSRNCSLRQYLDMSLPFDRDDVLSLVPESHRKRLSALDEFCGTAYRRTRNKKQVLEVRFDGLAGCLRTAAGGSSKQFVVVKDGSGLHARIMKAREAANLMGAPREYVLPNGENNGYYAMGDAVAVPVARFIGNSFLKALMEAAYGENGTQEVA